MRRTRTWLRTAREARRRRDGDRRRAETAAKDARTGAKDARTGAEAAGARAGCLAPAACAVAVLAVFGAFLAWSETTAGSRMERARAEGAAEADREAEAVGGWYAPGADGKAVE